MPHVGGLGSVKPATEEVQKLCDQVKAEVEEKHCKKYTTFKAIEYKTQMVAGTNYFVKVGVDCGEYLHLRLYKTLPHEGAKTSLTAALPGKTEEDEIVHFS